MDGIRAEAQRGPGQRRELRPEDALVRRREITVDARERHVRPEGLVVERDGALAERRAHRRAEAAELERALARAEPDDIRASALRKVPELVQDDVERPVAGRGSPESLGRRPELGLGDMADEGEGQVEERRGDVPERGEVSREEHRRALGVFGGELDRDEEADRRRLDPRGDRCRLDLIGDEEREEGDREDHGEHGQHGHPHRLVQLEALPGRLDQLAHAVSRSKQRAGCSLSNGAVTGHLARCDVATGRSVPRWVRPAEDGPARRGG